LSYARKNRPKSFPPESAAHHIPGANLPASKSAAPFRQRTTNINREYF